MRGFLHVLEILIVVLVVFGLILQFAIVPRVKDEWTPVRLQLLATDILQTLDRQGINWFNASAVSGNVSALLNASSLRFEVRVLHAPKPTARIGCYVCSAAQLATVATALRSVRVNGENISAMVDNVSAFSADYDAIVTFAQNLTPVLSEAQAFLRSDRGLVELRDLTDPLDVDAAQQALFGIQWNASLSPDGGPLAFATTENQSLNAIAKYYGFPQFQSTFDQLDASAWSVLSGTWAVLDNGTWDTDASGWNRASAGADRDNYTASANITLIANHTEANNSWAGIGARFSADERYLLLVTRAGAVSLQNATGTSMQRIAEVLGPGGANRSVRLGLRVNGSNLTAFVNGSALLSVSHPRLAAGRITLEASAANATFDNVQVSLFSVPNLLAAERIAARGRGSVVLVQPGTNASALVAQDGAVLGHGRTVWLTDGADEQAVPQLLKASVLWAAGEDALIVPGALGDTFVTARMPKFLAADLPQELEVQLRIGTLY